MNYTIIFPKNETVIFPENTPNICSATSTVTASTDMFECPTCNSKFYKLRLLRDHERRMHKRYILKVRDIKEKNFKCEFCEKRFSSLQTRSKHRIAKHGIKREYKRNAGGAIHLKFNTEQDFKEWLTSEELQTKSHFIMARGVKKGKDHQTIHYMCNRSGKFISRNTGKRKLKAQGSKKIGKNCDARLYVKIYEHFVEVTYFNEHNHELSLHHLPLPTAVKEVIAEKILNGECYNQILNDVRGNVEVPENRGHLVTRKDLNNIKSKLAMDLEASSKSTQFNSDYLDVSNSPQSSVIEQCVNTDEDVDDKTQILNNLIALRNKVTLMPEISTSTTTKVMSALESIETLLDSDYNSISNISNTPKNPNKGAIPQNKLSVKKQRMVKGKSSKSTITEHPTIQHIVLEELFVTQNPLPGQNYFIVQNQN